MASEVKSINILFRDLLKSRLIIPTQILNGVYFSVWSLSWQNNHRDLVKLTKIFLQRSLLMNINFYIFWKCIFLQQKGIFVSQCIESSKLRHVAREDPKIEYLICSISRKEIILSLNFLAYSSDHNIYWWRNFNTSFVERQRMERSFVSRNESWWLLSSSSFFQHSMHIFWTIDVRVSWLIDSRDSCYLFVLLQAQSLDFSEKNFSSKCVVLYGFDARSIKFATSSDGAEKNGEWSVSMVMTYLQDSRLCMARCFSSGKPLSCLHSM